MTKRSVLAGLTSMLLACNSTSNDHSSDHDTAQKITHDAHSSTGQDKTNDMVNTMNKMMEDMHAIKPTGNNDIDFAAMMIEHHKGAVEMSKVEMEKGSDPELKAFAQKVIDDQNIEIKFMEDLISKADRSTSSNSAAFQKALGHSMMAMMNDSTLIYNNIDKDFAAQMIPHHQSAVDMAKAYLQYGKQKGLITLSENIISSQEKEIVWLKQWLAKK